MTNSPLWRLEWRSCLGRSPAVLVGCDAQTLRGGHSSQSDIKSNSWPSEWHLPRAGLATEQMLGGALWVIHDSGSVKAGQAGPVRKLTGTATSSCSLTMTVGRPSQIPCLSGTPFFLPNPYLHPGQPERLWLLRNQFPLG